MRAIQRRRSNVRRSAANLAKQLAEAEEIWLAASEAYEDASTQTKV